MGRKYKAASDLLALLTYFKVSKVYHTSTFNTSKDQYDIGKWLVICVKR